MPGSHAESSSSSNVDRSHTRKNQRLPTMRLACNRCHAQKLRCSRSGNSDGPCDRCMRLGAECVYGQSRRMGRPREKSPQKDAQFPVPPKSNRHQTAEAQHQRGTDTYEPLSSTLPSLDYPPPANLETQYVEWSDPSDWTPWTPNDYISRPISSLDMSMPNSQNAGTALPIAARGISDSLFSPDQPLRAIDTTSQTQLLSQLTPARGRQLLAETGRTGPDNATLDIEECINQLSELQISLYRCFREISSITLAESFHSPESSAPSSVYPLSSSQDTSSTNIQRIYLTSQRYLGIINKITAALKKIEADKVDVPAASASSRQTPEGAQLPSTRTSLSTDSREHVQYVDSATTVLITSCYIRLILIYSSLVEKVEQLCVGSIQVDIPASLRVDVISSASSGLQTAMLLEFVSHINDRVGKATSVFLLVTGNMNGLLTGELSQKEEELRLKFTKVRQFLKDSTEL